MKPIALVDMDGPLAAFDALFFARCDENEWPMDCTIANQVHRFAIDHIPDKQQRAAARAMVNSSGWFRDLPVTEGAVEGLHQLAEVATVWVCTKPLEANPTCRDEKATWLVKHFGEKWERRLIITPDKSMIRGDVLLDDAPYIEWLDAAEWRIRIFPTNWNGEGSKWAGLRRWTWGDPIGDLLESSSRKAVGHVGTSGNTRVYSRSVPS